MAQSSKIQDPRSADPRALVVENDPHDDIRRLGEWLTDAGLELVVVRPHAGEPLPVDLAGVAALVVLGGGQRAYPGADGQPGAPWFGQLESLLRKAVRASLPTLGVCLGAQLLARAHGGVVASAVAGPELGPRLVAKRDVADRDPLFRTVPMLPDVVQWHQDEVTELPASAVLLATSAHSVNQAFRIGPCAWGTQFHLECDTAMVAYWASRRRPLLAELGVTAEEVVASVDALMDDLFEVWQPFASRFAALARGELGGAQSASYGSGTGRELPLLGH